MLQFTKFNFCPKCGSPDIAELEHNGMKCHECGLVYFHNTAAAVAALIETPSGILLVNRNHEPRKGFLDAPGGFVNYNESLENALKREIQEELSLELQAIEYLGSFPNVYIYKNITYFTTDVFFVCRFATTPVFIPNDEISGYSFYLDNDIPFEMLAFESLKNALKYKNGIMP